MNVSFARMPRVEALVRFYIGAMVSHAVVWCTERVFVAEKRDVRFGVLIWKKVRPFVCSSGFLQVYNPRSHCVQMMELPVSMVRR